MYKFIVSAIIVGFTGSAWAGSAMAEIRCESASKQTKVELNIEEMFEVYNVVVSLTQKGSEKPAKLEINQRVFDKEEGIEDYNENVESSVLFERNDGILVVKVQDNAEGVYSSFNFWGLPEGVKNIKYGEQGVITNQKFTARFRSTDPRDNDENPTPESEAVTVNCTLNKGIP